MGIVGLDSHIYALCCCVEVQWLVSLMANVVLHCRQGVSELLHCLGRNTAAVDAVQCVLARQLPVVAAIPASSSATYTENSASLLTD